MIIPFIQYSPVSVYCSTEGHSLIDPSGRKSLLDILTLHNRRKKISQFMHHHFRHFLARCSRNISISHPVFHHENIIPQTSGVASSRGDADVCLY